MGFFADVAVLVSLGVEVVMDLDQRFLFADTMWR